MTQPTIISPIPRRSLSIPFLSSEYSPSSVEKDALGSEDSPVKVILTDRYAAHLKSVGLMDEKGCLKFSHPEPLTLEPSDQEHIQKFWSKDQTFSSIHLTFSWNFQTFFSYLIPYFSKTFKGSRIELIQGALHAVGKECWREKIEKKLPVDIIEQFITSEMWSFCDQTPHCYELWICIPDTYLSDCSPEAFEKFRDLSIYFLAVQALPERPAFFFDALREFGGIIHPTLSMEEKKAQRIERLRSIMDEIKQQARISSKPLDKEKCSGVTLEVALSSASSLKITFSFLSPPPSCFALDHLHLDLDFNGEISSKLICSTLDPWQALHDHFIHRLVLLSSLRDDSQIQEALGSYWVHLTCHGKVFEDADFERSLLKGLVKNHENLISQITQAITRGKEKLPHSQECLLAYGLNVFHFICKHGIAFDNSLLIDLVEIRDEIHAISPFGLFVHQQLTVQHLSIRQFSAVLSCISVLQSRLFLTEETTIFQNLPRSYQSEDRSQVELTWDCTLIPLHCVLPTPKEETMQLLREWLRKDKQQALSCFSQALDLFFPASLSLQKMVSAKGSSPQYLEDIYQSLQAEEHFTRTTLLLFVLLSRIEGRAAQESDLLKIPAWLSYASSADMLDFALESLTIVYAQSPFAHLFHSIQERVHSLEEPTPLACQLASLQVLLLYCEPKILRDAWTTLFEKIDPSNRYDFLVEICPFLDEQSLPFALAKVCEGSHPKSSFLSAEKQANLLSIYLNQLLGLAHHLHIVLPFKQKLLSLFTPLLETKPSLYAHILAYPRLLEELSPPIPILLNSLRSSDSLFKKNDGLWWDRLANLQRYLEDQNSFDEHLDAFVNLFQIALQSSEARFISRLGSETLTENLMQKLVERKEFSRLTCLLQYLPASKDCSLVHRWLNTWIGYQITQQMCLDEWISTLASFHRKEIYRYLTPDLSVQLFHHLIHLISQEQKTPDAQTCHEMDLLQESLVLQRDEIPHHLELLLSYYSVLLQPQAASFLMDQMTRSLSLFIDQKETRIYKLISLLATLVKQSPKDRTLWIKFAGFLEFLKKEDFFGETATAVLELLIADGFLDKISFKDPPLLCFKKGFPKLEKRFSTHQKQRLACIYARVVELAMKEQKEKEVIGTLPSLEWLLETLRTEETWQAFTTLFFRLFSRRKIDYSDPLSADRMLWIAPRLFSQEDSPLIAEFGQMLLLIPVQNLKPRHTDWKAFIARLIAKDPSSSFVKRLFPLLISLASEDEKRFFNSCNQAPFEYQRRLLHEYSTTRKVPTKEKENALISSQDTASTTRLKIEQALARTAPTAKTMESTLKLLAGLSNKEYELWEIFFKQLLDHTNLELLERAWELWLKKHPAQDVQPSEGKYWASIITSCLSAQVGVDHILTSLLNRQLFILLGRLESNECQEIVSTCLNQGSKICWEEGTLQSLPQLQSLLFSPTLKQKIGDPFLLLTPEMQIRFLLILAQSEDFFSYLFCHEKILCHIALVFTDESYSSELNRLVFTAYCEKPYVPKEHFDQLTFYTWIERSYASLNAHLSWSQACTLVGTLCKFDYTKKEGENASLNLGRVFAFWKSLVAQIWKNHEPVQGFTNIVIKAVPFHKMHTLSPITRLVMNLLKKEIPDHTQMLSFLGSIDKYFISLISYQNVDKHVSLTHVQLSFCYHVFSSMTFENSKEATSILYRAINILQSHQDFIKTVWDTTSQKAVKAFISSLPVILSTGAIDDQYLREIYHVIYSSLISPRSMNAELGEPHAWEAILLNLCKSIRLAFPERRKKIALAVRNILIHCLSPHKLSKKVSIASVQNLIPTVNTILAFYFLPLVELECLNSTEWDELFKELSDDVILSLLQGLSQKFEKEIQISPFSCSLSIARLIRYAPSHSPTFLSNLVLYAMKESELQLLPINHQQDILTPLRVYTQWIHALSALMERYCKQKEIQNIEQIIQPLRVKRIQLTKELMRSILYNIKDEESYKAYTPYLIEILSNDLEVVTTMLEIFQIPSDLPKDLKVKMSTLQNLLEKRTHMLQMKIQ